MATTIRSLPCRLVVHQAVSNQHNASPARTERRDMSTRSDSMREVVAVVAPDLKAAGRLRIYATDQRLPRCDVHDRDHGQWCGSDDRRRLELPPSYPNYCATWIEITGTDGSSFDHTQRDNWLNTEKHGQEFPMSTMPGEWVDNVFAGGMGPETIHFLEACIRDTPVMVTPESARRVMETYSAADLSADRNEPVDLPLI